MPSPAVSDPSCTDVLSEEESKPQRRKRERGRRPLGSENVAPEATGADCCAQTKAHSNDVAHVFQEAQVHGRCYHLSSYSQADDAQSYVIMVVQPHDL